MGKINYDLQAVMERDPAATSKLLVRFTYGGYKAIRRHRRANWLYKRGFKTLAIIISARTRRLTGIDIHPAAQIGNGVFIDHGVGVVIGETCEIEDNVTIYQGVTLGGTGKDVGKRHPTIRSGVMISAGAKVLGPIEIGKNSKIGAGSVVLKAVPPHSTVVGVPGRIVKMHDEKVTDFNHKLPDPIIEEFKRVGNRLKNIEDACGINACRYSIVDNEIIENEEFIQDSIQDKKTTI